MVDMPDQEVVGLQDTMILGAEIHLAKVLRAVDVWLPDYRHQALQKQVSVDSDYLHYPQQQDFPT